MNFKVLNQIPIFDKFAIYYGKRVDTLYSEMQTITVNVCTNDIISTISSGDSPFFQGKDSNGYKIEYAIKCCDDYQFTDNEKFALIAHELGHIILELNNQDSDNLQEELQADEIASEIVDRNYLKNALQKIADLIDINNDWSELDVSPTSETKNNLITRIESLQ